MNKPEEMKIRIKPVKQKAKRSQLPAELPSDYPENLPAVFIAESALASLKTFAASDLSYELGGILIGSVGKDSKRLFVRIENFIPARKGVSHRASFEFTNEAQQQIHEEMQERFRDSKIVGWFHTHPGYGIFLSNADQFIDQHYFTEKWHVALVLDPTKRDVDTGAFVWKKKGERLRVPLCLCGES